MKKRVALLFLFHLSLLLNAQWQSLNGPSGDGVTDFLQVGDDLLISTYNGIFRSSDQGASWVHVGDVLRGIQIDGMASWNGALFAFSDPEDRLFRSDDAGVTWAEIFFTGLQFPIYTLHQITATESALFLCTPNLLRSLDGGVSWANVSLPAAPVYYYTRLIAQGDTLFVTIQNAGVYRSTDQGDSWELLSSQLPKAPYRSFVYGDQLVASFYSTSWKVYQSNDQGQTWTQDVTPGLSGALDQYAVVAGQLYALRSANGLWRRALDGNIWTQIADKTTAPFIAASNVPVTFRVKFFNGGGRFFATSYDGVFYSDNGGVQWQETSEGLLNISVRDILPTTDALFCAGRTSLYRFDQNSVNWSLQGADIEPGTIILRLSEVNGQLFTGARRRLWRSVDQGVSWQGLPIDLIDYYTQVIPCGNTLLAGSSWGVYRSTDNGDSWTGSSEGMGRFDFDVFVYPFVESLAALGDTVLAAAGYGLFRSEDQGQHWTLIDSTVLTTNLYQFGQRLYRVTAPAGAVFYSDDTGFTWNPMDLGHSDGARCMAAHMGYLLAGSRGGVLVSDDDGLSWTFYGTGMPVELWVSDLETDAAYIYAGTNGEGVWRLPLSAVVVTTGTQKIEAREKEVAVYPSPATSEVWVDFPLQPGAQATVRVLDGQGRLLREMRATSVPVQVDCADLLPGIYFLQIESGPRTRFTGQFFVK